MEASIESTFNHLSTLPLPPPYALEVAELSDDIDKVPGEIVLDKEGRLLKEYLTYRGFTNYLNESFDQAILRDIPGYICNMVISIPDTDRVITFDPKSFMYRKPTDEENGQVKNRYPQTCRDRSMTYDLTIYADMIEVKRSDPTAITNRKKVNIGAIPMPLGCSGCYLHGMDEQQRSEIGECPHDPLGYFIVDGQEKVLLLLEMLR